jgi:hypothetical protein
MIPPIDLNIVESHTMESGLASFWLCNGLSVLVHVMMNCTSHTLGEKFTRNVIQSTDQRVANTEESGLTSSWRAMAPVSF